MLFQMFYIFLMTAEKKNTDLSSFSFIMVGEAYEMKGSEMKTLKDEELSKWKQAETESV